MPALDPANTHPAYVSGRVFAVIEEIQRAALPGLNTTYGDRFFSGAVTNPRAALVTGGRDAKAWLKKLRGRKQEGLAVHLANRLDSVVTLLDASTNIPSRMSLGDQALFLLGYHHQRAHRDRPAPATDQ